MKRLQSSLLRGRIALLVGVVALLVLVASGTVFAAGEQLRGIVPSGGGTITSDGLSLRSVIGLPVAGSSVSSSSGLGLCSGFDCEVRGDTGGSLPDSDGDGVPDESDPDDGDPCVPNADSPACDSGSDPDADGDGVPESSDPDDSDPCVPNPDSPACEPSSSSRSLYVPFLDK